MKFNFKKISAIATSALMVGMTMGVAAAAAYPNPFVVGGSADVAIVYGTGTGVSDLDQVQAYNINLDLQSYMGASSATTATTAGETKRLGGSGLLYLLDDLAENGGIITKDDLPTILADGDFVDDDGSSWKFEQTISVGTDNTNRFSFGNSDNDFDDPALMLELSRATGTPMYTWTLSFDKATNLTASASEGEEITMFGKTYTIGTATDYDTLILLGGADSTKISVGEVATMTVEGNSYEVTLDGLSSATTTVASITIDGTTKTFTQGQTKTYVLSGGEVDVYAKTIFRTGDDLGHVELSLGADKLTIENGNAIQVGSDTTDIDGTAITITPTPGSTTVGPGFGNVTKIEIAVAAEDTDSNHILMGESFTDPVFKTLRLELNQAYNGPVFSGESDTGRTVLELKSGGSRELSVMMTDKTGVVKTIPFVYQDWLADDSSNPFVTVEGNNLTDDDYFILNSGDYQHLMRVTKVNLASITTSDIEIQDQFTGTKYLVENKDFTAGQNVTINSQTYVITNNTNSDGANGGFRVESADAYATTHRALFPYMELVAGEDFPRVAFINQTNLINDATGDTITSITGASVSGRIYEVPTGTVQFRASNISTTSWIEYGATPAGGSTTWTNISGSNGTSQNWTSVQIGEAWYAFATTATFTGGLPASSSAVVVINNVTLDLGFDTYAEADMAQSPVIMFVEDKDKSDADARNVILLNTTDDGTYSELEGDALFSGTTQHDDETWDTTEYKGYLTNYGTYLLRDRTDTNIHVAKLTYGDSQMYADVYFAETGATITPGSSSGGGTSQIGNIVYKDSETSSYSSKNVVVIGGSCINSAAASLVGGAYCTTDWTDATGVGSGEFLIKGYSGSSVTSKLALLVAGYGSADTVNAATYLTNKKPDTGKAWKGTTATAAATEITAA